MLRIGLPVSRKMEITAGLESLRELAHPRRLNQSPLVMAFFMPGVREKNVDGIQGLRRQRLRENIDSVFRINPDVLYLFCQHSRQQSANTGTMYLYPDELRTRVRLSHLYRLSPIPKPISTIRRPDAPNWSSQSSAPALRRAVLPEALIPAALLTGVIRPARITKLRIRDVRGESCETTGRAVTTSCLVERVSLRQSLLRAFFSAFASSCRIRSAET